MNSNQRYFVLSATVIINLIVGITYIWSIISKELTAVYNWSARAASLPYILALAFMPFAMILGGQIADSGKPCYSIRIGSILWGLGLVLCGLFITPASMIVSFGIIFGTGVGIISGSSSATAVKWFSAGNKGTVSGISLAASAFSSVYMALLFQCLLKNLGLSRSLLGIGVVGMVIMLLASYYIRSPKTQNNTTDKSASYTDTDFSWKEMLHTFSFWKIWIILALADSSALMIIGNLASIALYQANIENAVVLVMILNFANAVGRMIIGNLSDRIGIRNALFISLGLQLVNMLLFRQYSSYGWLIFGASLAGFSFGGIMAMLNPLAAQFGTAHLAVNAAVINTAYSIGGLLMPYVSAYIVDRTGSYHSSYLTAAAMLIIAAIVTIFYHNKVIVLRDARQ